MSYLYVSGSQIAVPTAPGLVLCTTGFAPGVAWRMIEEMRPSPRREAAGGEKAQSVPLGTTGAAAQVALCGAIGTVQIPTFSTTIPDRAFSWQVLQSPNVPKTAIYSPISLSVSGAKVVGLAGLLPNGRLVLWPSLAKNDAAWEPYVGEMLGIDGFSLSFVVAGQ